MRSSTPTTGMHRALATAFAAAAFGFSAGVANSQPAPAPVPPPPLQMLEYAVKFVCGKAGVSTAALPVPVAPGFYFTAINVHNPSAGEISFRKKFVQALVNQKPGRISGFVPAFLKSDEAFDVECTEITKQLGLAPTTFVTGFVVFQSPAPRELDIVAVYTAAASSSGPVVAIQTERVPKRP